MFNINKYRIIEPKWLFLFYLKGVEEVKIKDIVKEKQFDVYKKLMKERKEHLSFKDIEELMGVHEQVLKKKRGAYKRVR
ncbi:MAG: hypothetical protein KatS3mg079_669 [Caloramator sp.]|nr:MAG: hypothetical protein KatS3mg079_669 [Caloramator sp.]